MNSVYVFLLIGFISLHLCGQSNAVRRPVESEAERMKRFLHYLKSHEITWGPSPNWFKNNYKEECLKNYAEYPDYVPYPSTALDDSGEVEDDTKLDSSTSDDEEDSTRPGCNFFTLSKVSNRYIGKTERTVDMVECQCNTRILDTDGNTMRFTKRTYFYLAKIAETTCSECYFHFKFVRSLVNPRNGVVVGRYEITHYVELNDDGE